jgi:hydrogenase nickel incorporation protein HypA/HybF
MHEMSLAGGILTLVEDAATREGFRRVSRLNLQCGKLAGVELAALRFALDVVSRGTVLEGAEVLIDEPPGDGQCLACGQAVEVLQRGQDCPHCGSAQVVARGGDQLRVVDMIVHDDPAPADPGATS